MADEMLRRNLEASFDPGPDFPNSLLLSRTMAALNADAGSAAGGMNRKSPGQYSLTWLRPGMRLTAVLMAVTVAVAATAAFLAIHRFFAPAPVQSHSSSVSRSCSQGNLHMVTSSVGWNGTSRTTDGGVTWKDVSPAWLPNETNGGRVACLLDTNHAWVTEVVGSSDSQIGRLYVFGTHDGGQNWQSSGPFPVSGAPPSIQLDFVNDHDGWLQTAPGKYSNQPGTPLVYSTTDGGVHWTQLAARPDGVWPPGTWLGEYYFCDPSGMMFVSSTRGWLVRDCNTHFFDTSVMVGIVTNDGGHSWLALKLDYAAFPPHIPVPNAVTPLFWNCGASTPVFTGTNGVLPVSCEAYKGLPASNGSWSPGAATGSGWSATFRTSDAGISWVAAPLPAYVGLSQIEFVDSNTGFAFVKRASGNDLYNTTNAGRDWSPVKTGLFPGQNVMNYQFIDLTTGFAYTDRSSGSVWKTTDGGRTWAQTAP